MRLRFFPAVLLFFLPMNLLSIHLGHPALEREFQSAIQIWTIENGKPKYLCSGVVISKDTVLTAASCILGDQNPEHKATTLFVSTTHKMDFRTPLTHALQNVSSIAKKGIRHEDYDLMIIFLNQPLDIEPSLLFSEKETVQIPLLGQVVLAGHGLKAEPIQSSKVGDWWNGFWGHAESDQPGEKIIAKSNIQKILEHEFQIGTLKSDGSACLGDQGAPVYAHIDTPFSNSQRVLGIVIASEKLTRCERPTRVLRLDAVRDFINDKMVHECKAGTRSWCEVEGLFAAGYDEQPIREKPPVTTDATPDPVVDNPKDTGEAKTPPPEHILTPNPPKPDRSVNKPEKRQSRRRLSARAEGVGCSCQQVFRGQN